MTNPATVKGLKFFCSATLSALAGVYTGVLVGRYVSGESLFRLETYYPSEEILEYLDKRFSRYVPEAESKKTDSVMKK